MQYAPFEPLPEDIANRENAIKVNSIKRQGLIQSIVTKYKLVELRSDYLGRSSFYYDRRNNFIWEVNNDGFDTPKLFKPTFDVYMHIANLNNIQIPGYQNQKQML